MKNRKDQRGYESTNKGRELSKWVDNWLVQFDKEEGSSRGEVSNSLPEVGQEE